MKTKFFTTALALILGMMIMTGQNTGTSVSSTGKILHDIFALSAETKDPASPASLASLQKEAETLMQKAVMIRREATHSIDKKKLLNEAYALYKQSEAKQIELSKATEKIMKEQFNSNVERFNALLQSGNANGATIEYALDLFDQAKRAMRLAGEMREEANALPNISQTLGSMNNAEEKEWIAVQRSGEALNIAGSNNIAKPRTESIAVK